MPRTDPMDLWFAFMYRRWRTSVDVLKMRLPEKGIFVDILAALAENGGKLPRDPWTLRRILDHQDYRPIKKWLEKYKHLTACPQCVHSEVTVQLQCTHSEFTVPKFTEFQEKLRKSRVLDVPKKSKSKEERREEQTDPPKQAPAEPEPTPVSDSGPRVECSVCGYTPCSGKGRCNPASPLYQQAHAQPEQKKPELHQSLDHGRKSAAPQPKADSLRGWTEDINGVPAERIRLCVRWKLDHDSDDTWYRDKISTKSLRNPGFVKKLDSECPDSSVIEKAIKATIKTEWKYDPNCPRKCNKGKLTVGPDSMFPSIQHCECLKQVEVA